MTTRARARASSAQRRGVARRRPDDAHAADGVEERARHIGVEGVGGAGRRFGGGAHERRVDGGGVTVEARADGVDDVDDGAIERVAGRGQRLGRADELARARHIAGGGRLHRGEEARAQ